MIFRNRYVWIVFVLVSVLSGYFSFRYFSEAFPLIRLNLQMERSEALTGARDLARQKGWGPAAFRQAASFGLDSVVQNFVELEGGGKGAFRQMVVSGLYSPFTWTVRHYQEYEKTTTIIRFTPAGEAYGFVETLPEDEPGASLAPEDARSLAEDQARTWGVQLEDYLLVEESRERRPSGRTDHSFVFERPDSDIGEGRYRLRLTVSGDRLTELTHFVKVPEGFSRRYEEMRSANNTIGVVGSVAMALLYILGGCVVGIFILVRKGWFLWRYALIWGCLVALLQAMSSLNQLPLFWMSYDTALSIQDFLLRQLVLVLVEFLALAALLSLSFMAAESLGRRAFPNHAQLWKVWSRGNGNSRQVLGQTAGGFLLVPLFFGYEVVLYFFSQRLLGWWTPSDALIEPNVLATYFPWVTAIANSLQAGFWEECLFRAVPLASAALLGQRFGRRRLWIAAAMLLQALIFGAGHAPYATQPAYARVVELIVPSFLFGWLYLSFGLLPAVVLHFAFDVVWFALPLFVASGPGALNSQVVVVLLTLMPLWVVLWRRGQSKSWCELPASERNGAWQVDDRALERPVEEALEFLGPTRFGSAVGKRLLGLGILGLVSWLVLGSFDKETQGLDLTRPEAIQAARSALEEKGIELSEDWQVLTNVAVEQGTEHAFIWRSGGKELYRKLLGSYLDPPLWHVRFARFEGDIEERAEEFHVFIGRGGQVYRIQHRLPESREKESLSTESATELALLALKERYGFSPDQLEEVSREPTNHPNRVDWQLTYRDRAVDLAEGEARVSLKVAGQDVADAFRYVHVPEEWRRQERSRTAMVSVVRILCVAILGLVWLAGVVFVVATWSRRGVGIVAFATSAALVFGASAFSMLNRWPALKAAFDTAQPVSHQILVLLAGGFMSALVMAGFSGLVMGLGAAWHSRGQRLGGKWSLALGAAAASITLGLWSAGSRIRESVFPERASFEWADSLIPLLGPAVSAIPNYALLTALLLLVAILVDGITHSWNCRRFPSGSILFLSGFAVNGLFAESLRDCLLFGLPTGLLFLLFYLKVVRFDLSVIAWVAGFLMFFASVKEIMAGAYPGSSVGEALAAGLVLVIAAVCWRLLGGSRAIASGPGMILERAGTAGDHDCARAASEAGRLEDSP